MENVSYIELPREMLQQIQTIRNNKIDSQVLSPGPARIQTMQQGIDSCVFKFPKDVHELDDGSNFRQFITSPRSKDNVAFYGENSDWMMAERQKSRTPPSSPQTPSSHQGNFGRAKSPAIRIEVIKRFTSHEN